MLRELTRRYPAYAEGWFVRSSIESRTGLGLAAIQAATAALSAAPARALYRANLAQMQVNYGDWGDALSTLEPLRDAGTASFDAKIANAVGSVLSITGNEEAAQTWFEHAVSRAHGNRLYAYNAAQGLIYCGRIDEARQAFERLLQRDPDFAKAHWSLATFDAKHRARERLDMLRDAIGRASSPVDEVMYCYALFSTLDSLDRTDEAFTELSHGMRLQRARIGYQGQDAEALRRITAIGCDFLDVVSAAPPIAAPGQPQPVFILGLPRSGTTVVERILGNHPQVVQGGELTAFPAAMRRQLGVETINPMMTSVPAEKLARRVSVEGLRDDYLHQIRFRLQSFQTDGPPFITDKYPFNFMLLPWIAAAFPNSPILHLIRDPMDVCFGNIKQLFSGAYGACYAQEDMAAYYLAQDEMMRTWKRRLPGRVLDIHYEALVEDPACGAARILDFCGLHGAEDAWRIERNTRAVATASTTQVREPINARGVGAWRRYEAHLQPLLRRLDSRHSQ